MKMKISPKITKLLTNKTVLMVVTILAAITLIMFLVLGSFNNIMYFIILAILVRCFSKNMIVVLGIPVVLVNLYALYNQNASRKEGMESTTTTTSETTDATTPATPTSLSGTKKSDGLMPGTEMPASNENFNTGNKKNKYKVDYATTVEEAYDNLNNILGTDGLNKLTAETKQLVEKQTQLAESMKSMGPMIKQLIPMANQAKELMSGMNSGDGNLGELMKMAKEMTGKIAESKV
jgi:hypothetical protein